MNLDFTHPVKCYDGAYDSKSQRVLDARREAMRLIREREPEAHATFHNSSHYGPGGTVIHVWGREISGYHSTYADALRDAMARLDIEYEQ
jgi:hypothetical protein